MSNLSTLPKGDSAWLLRKAIERIIQQVSVLETNIGASTSGNSANTQIIFNDNGTLRGDAGLVYNKTTDTLTVAGLVTAGSATITGDLTVATDAFKVISATKDVCIGTVTPTFNNKLTVVGGGGGDAFITSGNGTRTGYIGTDGTTVIMGGYSNHTLRIQANDLPQMQIAPLGVFEWFDGAGGTRMTLNSTGLGIGDSPSYKLHVAKTTDGTLGFFRRISGTINPALTVYCNETGNTVGFGTDYAGATSPSITFTTGGAERLRIDGSGNVGIGVTPSAWDTSVFKAIQIGTGIGQATVASRTDNVNNTAYGLNYYYGTGAYRYIAAGRATSYEQANGKHYWNIDSGTQVIGAATSFTQAMTLDASGNLLVGKTALSSATAGIQLEAVGAVTSTRSAGAAAYFNRLTSDGFLVLIGRQSSIVGDISVTTTGTTFNSTSDYRLKEAVQPLVGGLARVSALKPSVYKWKANGSAGEGFLAHELAEVVPAAVTGEKDAVNADGSIKAQSIDMSRVVPILVAAIQELTARVQTLEAR